MAHLFERGHVAGERLAVSKLVRTVAALRVQKIEKAGGALLVRVFADVAGLLSRFDVTAAVKLDNLVVGAKGFIGIDNVGSDLLSSFTGLFLRLGDGVPGAGDFALVPIENRKLHIEEERPGVCGGDMG